MKIPQISVIIPTKNRPIMLKKAIKSVLLQTIRCHELIVIDDNTDHTVLSEIKQAFGQQALSVLHTGGNRGGGYARNLGIDAAKGDFVAFLDDDDEWIDTKIEKQMVCMNGDAELFYSGRNIWKQNCKKPRYSFHAPSSDDHYKSIMIQNFIGSTSTVIIKKEVLQEVGGFDSNLLALQDYDLYIRILKRYRVNWVNEALINYYDHHTGDQVSGNREFFLQAVAYLKKKYHCDPYYKYLKRSLFYINLLKMFRSRHFLMATLKSGIYK
jgi:glycosyltransferase involved in cell wall biosynthesis